MFYIDLLGTTAFPIGLVKTESSFIARSDETGLGRWTLMVAVISVDEGHKNYTKYWCLINSQPTFLFLTYLNLMNYGHIIQSM